MQRLQVEQLGARTLGCEKRCRRLNEGPPQMAAPCRCMVARYEPCGDHATNVSVQNERLYTCTRSMHRLVKRGSGMP